MFKSLRLKLTLLTVSVIIALFTFFSGLLYMQIQYNSERGCDYGLKKITEEVINNHMIDFPEPEAKTDTNKAPVFKSFMPMPARPNFFFIKLRCDGTPLYASRGVTVEEATLFKLLSETMAKPEETGNIMLGESRFAYLKTKLPDEDGVLLVYNDLRNQDENMEALIRHLIITCLLTAMLAWFIIYHLSQYAIKPIEASVEQQKNFVSDASHELRTPITIIQTNLDIIKGAVPGETVEDNKKWLQNIQDETSRMTELINTLLFLARADANHQLLEKEYFLLQPVFSKAILAFQPMAEKKNLTLECNIDAELVALGDATRLKQVLTILIDNAIRHTPEGGQVTTTASADKSQLTISVTDTGEGMAPKHLNKIFNRFYQVDESRHNGGSGLGLSMAKWIIEKHGGQIYANSIVGQGSTFTIKLPIN